MTASFVLPSLFFPFVALSASFEKSNLSLSGATEASWSNLLPSKEIQCTSEKNKSSRKARQSRKKNSSCTWNKKVALSIWKPPQSSLFNVNEFTLIPNHVLNLLLFQCKNKSLSTSSLRIMMLYWTTWLLFCLTIISAPNLPNRFCPEKAELSTQS